MNSFKRTFRIFRIGLVLLLTGFTATYILKTINVENVQAEDSFVWQSQLSDLNQQSEKIIVVDFLYDKKSSQSLTVQSAKIKSGYQPNTKVLGKSYVIQQISGNGKILSNNKFIIPNELHGVPSIDKPNSTDNHIILSSTSFAIPVKWNSLTSKLQIISPDGQIIQEINSNQITRELASEDYKSLDATKFLEENTASAGEKLDIVFVGDKYGKKDSKKYTTDIENFINKFLSFEPYHSRASQIEFHYIEKKDGFDCKYFGRILACDKSKVINTVTSAGVPYDKIAVIVNSETYGGGGNIDQSCCAVSYNGSWGPEVFVHEISHSMGLVDEYIARSEGAITNDTLGNCYRGQPPAQVWKNLVADEDYTLSCYAPNWYSASSTSLMREIDQLFFNAPSQEIIENEIERIAGNSDDTIPPKINIISPNNNSRVFGMVNIKVNATDNAGVARVELLVNDKLIKTDYLGPYEFSLQTTSLNDGVYQVKVKAHDGNGNSKETPTLLLEVDNDDSNPNENAPIIHINSPTDNYILPKKGKINISIQIDSEKKLKKTNVFLRGKTVKKCGKKNTCVFNLGVNKFAKNKPNILKVVSTDAKGNTSTKSVTVYRN